MIVKTISAIILIGTLAVPAMAARPGPDAAVRSSETAARLTPADGGAVIELATAYRRAGRTAEANTAFRRALVLDNVMLETPTGDAIWSHEVARRALAYDLASTSR